MQKNIANKNSKENKDIKANKKEEEDDMQLNIIGNIPNKVKEEVESESDSEEEDIKNIKSENLNVLNDPEHQDIFDSESTFKSIGVSFKLHYSIFILTNFSFLSKRAYNKLYSFKAIMI